MADAARIAQSYRDLKIKWVEGLSGGSVWEINAVCSVAPAAVFFWSVLQSRYRFFDHSNPLALPVDFLLNICAILAAVTVYADYSGLLLALLVVPSVAIYLAVPASSLPQSRNKPKGSRSNDGSGRPGLSDFPVRPYLTAYRGGMLIATAIAILAVDFPVFPRRFAKVETWGTSFMDIGVGSFVFSGGIMSAKPALKARMGLNKGGHLSKDRESDSANRQQAGFFLRLVSALRASTPLLILGLIRLYSVKSLEYPEHVSEYGVHWNFFFTLGFLPIGMALVEPLLAALPSRMPSHLILALVISFLHGLALDIRVTGLREWVLFAPRVDLVSKNREGIVSVFGYLAIFLLGMEAGSFALPRDPVAGLGTLISARQRQPSPRTHRRNTLLLHAACSAFYAALTWALVNPIVKGVPALGPPVSRRIANPPYVFWIAAFNHLQLFLYAAVETLLFPGAFTSKSPEEEKREAERASSTVLTSYNVGGLAIFLLSNLGTGLVNLTVNTLDSGRLKAMGILVVYMTACTVAAIGLTKSGIKLKL